MKKAYIDFVRALLLVIRGIVVEHKNDLATETWRKLLTACDDLRAVLDNLEG
jgi:hypothetical protein